MVGNLSSYALLLFITIDEAEEMILANYTFAEHGEDILVHRLMLWKKNGFYLDCGAYHPEKMSLTARLRYYGWSGINVDLDEKAIKLFDQYDRNSINICAIIGRDEVSYEVMRFEDCVINTVSDIQKKHLNEIINRGQLEIREINSNTNKGISIKTLLDIHHIKNNSIDFMNLDIEGMELVALEGFPFDTQFPKVIAVEIHRLNLYEIEKNNLVSFLKNKGYRLQSYVFHTCIFVPNNFEEEICHRFNFPIF